MSRKKKYQTHNEERKSIRLAGYDYSQPGAYFITICVNKRLSLLGDVVGSAIALSELGRLTDRWWRKLSEKFSNIELDQYTIMPNHVHGVILIVGADPCVCPKSTDPRVCPKSTNTGEHAGSPLHRVVQWFKTMSTNEYFRAAKQKGMVRFERKLWQRGYYEHIVRNENELNRIREYILYNPLNWALDRENPLSENFNLEHDRYWKAIYEKGGNKHNIRQMQR